jgi:hypothetical protein
MKAINVILTTWYMLYDAVMGYFFSDFPNFETMSWELCNLDTCERTSGITHHEFKMTDDYPVLLHNVTRTLKLNSVMKTAVHWVDHHRAPYFYTHMFQQPPAPWFFIGYKETDDSIVDCTAELDRIVMYDNFITADLLHTLIPSSREKTWVYVHPKTFEEVEFPSDGILIEDESTRDDSKSD